MKSLVKRIKFIEFSKTKLTESISILKNLFKETNTQTQALDVLENFLYQEQDEVEGRIDIANLAIESEILNIDKAPIKGYEEITALVGVARRYTLYLETIKKLLDEIRALKGGYLC